jgi:hypothetical protein
MTLEISSGSLLFAAGLGLAILLPPAALAGVIAPPDDAIFNEANGHYYQAFEEALSANSAASACEGLGGYLVTITSQAEQNFVQGTFIQNSGAHWIGFFQEADSTDTDAGWEWVTGETVDYTNWGGGEPNDGDGTEDNTQNCARIVENDGYELGDWDDIECNTSLPYICEWEQATEPEPAPVPAMGAVGLLALVAGLGVFGLFGLRRSRRP